MNKKSSTNLSPCWIFSQAKCLETIDKIGLTQTDR